jgi:2-keto-3-deoxy-L-rhamnonate aldolase RhmA
VRASVHHPRACVAEGATPIRLKGAGAAMKSTLCLMSALLAGALCSPLAAQYQTTPAQETAPQLTVNPVKHALASGQTVIGATITAASADIAASLAGAGYDFLWIEMEHSGLTLETARNMILATRGLKAVPIIRVPFNEPWLAKRALDIGALGVIFPFTSTRELAEQAVQACKYPPLGIRGFGPGLATSRWGITGEAYVMFANENVMVIPIIETKQAVDNIDQIASVPGIDVLFIGPNDLSFSLGVGGRTKEPVVEEAVAKVLAAGRRHNIAVGYSTGDPAEINRRIEQGFRFFQTSSDLALMGAGARQLLSQIRRPAASSPP